jgi:glycosyltransferase involved in cell wall biosynthesis
VNPAPLVTVVTPFYNAAAYLSECIESVLAQTYDHWEYVLVDNQSTDGSLAIAESYARRDPRIRVYATETLLDQDRNYSEALRRLSDESRYVKIVQADDWIFPPCLEEMVAVAEAHPSVGLVSSYYLKGPTVMAQGLPYPSPVVPGRDLCRLQFLEGFFFFGSPTVPLIRTEIVRRQFPFYDSTSLHADTESCYRVLREWDFGFVHQVLSFLRVDNASRMGTVRDFAPHDLDKLIVVTKFGHDYLDPQEFRLVYRLARNRYYGILAHALLRGRSKAFWDYHRAGLATIEHRLQRLRLAKHVLLELVDLALNPKMTAGRVWGFVRARLAEHRDDKGR